MIEVEKKFRVTSAELEALLVGATKTKEKINVDIFYDTEDFALSGNWTWLRQRNGAFELKVPMHPPRDGMICDVFTEYETDDEIREHLRIPFIGNSLVEDLRTTGYKIFAEITTQRSSYSLGEFIIDIDHTTADGFAYDIVEIELMVSSEAEVIAAQEKIITLAKERGLQTGFVNGKVLEYIVQKNPAQLAVLRANGFNE